MKLNELYPYMYYRVARWYFKFESKHKISYGASVLVSLSQIMIITDIVGIVTLFSFKQIERQQLFGTYKYYYIIFILIVSFINDSIYKNKYEKYREKWESQTQKEKNVYGVVVFVLIFVPLIILPIILNIYDFTV